MPLESPHKPLSRIAVTAILLLSAVAAAPATAQPRKVYLQTCEDDDLRRLADLRAALDSEEHERAAEILDALFKSASKPKRMNRLRKIDESHYQGLGAHLLTLLSDAPAPVWVFLSALQREGAAQSLREKKRPSPQFLVRRYPTSEEAAKAAETLWSRAFESGDLGQCESLRRFLTDLHPERLRTPSGYARLVLLHATQGQSDAAKAALKDLGEKVGTNTDLLVRTQAASRAFLAKSKTKTLASAIAPAPQATLEETSNVRLNSDKPAAPPPPIRPSRRGNSTPERRFSPSFPMLRSEVLCVSNGATLAFFGLDGKPRGTLPLHGAAASTVPPRSTGFQARLASWANVGFAPLVLERWLAPARHSEEGDASLNDRFYSLVAFDPKAGRVLWWDGDAGPKAAEPTVAAPSLPPGWSQAGKALLDVLSKSHVLACAADSRRVYVALTIKGEEPELRLAAFELDTGRNQQVVLRPAWDYTTFLLSSERFEGSSEEESLAAEIAACLTLDGRGRLVCTTNLGITACLETGEGRLLWLYKGRPDRRRAGNFRSGSRGPRPLPPPPEPARFVIERGRERVVFFANTRLISVQSEDGVELWRRDCGEAHRLIAQENQLVAYGGNDARVFAIDGTRLGEHRLPMPCVGQGVRLGSCLLLPLMSTRGRRVVTINRYDFRMAGRLRLVPISSTPLSRVQDAVNLSHLPGGLVASSRERIVFFRWR